MLDAHAVTRLDHTEIAFFAHPTSELVSGYQRREFDNIDRLRFDHPW